MGDLLTFHRVIRYDSSAPVDGLIAWISLVRVDPGEEQSVDLEDWSAHKAVTAERLAPGEALKTAWQILDGHYRIAVSVFGRGSALLVVSPFSDFTVREKSVVESERILPVALGMPLVLVTVFG